MVEAKTITIGALILALVGTSSVLLYQNLDMTKNNYYCDVRPELGAKQCDSLAKYGVENGKCIVNGTGFICKTGWTLIKNDVPISKESTETLTYQCKPSGCEV